jgi:hypothetical protein
MKNKELFNLNPDENNLLNDGVVEINTAKDAVGYKIIKHELKTFVCEGEYQNGMQRILDTFLGHIDNKQPAVWVSGFFGSGKSHFVKMLSYLWEDFEFPNGEKARMIKPLPKEVNDLFVELERKQQINGRLAITGTLKDFPSKDIRNSFLQLFLNELGLPQQYHLFKFIYWLRQEGIHDELKALVEAQGKDFKKEYENLFVSSAIAKALLELKPEFAENEAKVKENFKATFVRQETISKEQLINTIKTEILPLRFGAKIPLTIIVLDEVQQFIGTDGDKSIDVQNLAQELSSNFEGKFLLVATGQNALTDTSMLQKLMDRFTVKVSFSDTDVDTVTRKTVLEKKPSVINEVKTKLEAALGEISRNLNGSEYGYVTDDNKNLVADYPILPSTRKFWKKVLNAIDTAGTSGQLRSQLRIVDESIKNVAQKDLGAIVPADLIFEQKQPQLIQNARLLNETNNLIEERKSKGGDSLLEGRILSAVFLIDLLPDGKDRLKSNENTIADLLLDDISKSSDTFRTKVNELIKKLVEEKILMPIGDEYKLQTKVGSEWEQEFAKQFAKFNSSGEDQIQNYRKERIVAFFKDKTKTINITQGVSKIVRDFELWDKDTMPNTEHNLNAWIRDGWYENQATVLNEIRSAGNDFPLSYIFVKKLKDPELRAEILKYLAAGQTINAMGLPSTPEGEQARKSMDTRLSMSKTAIEDLIAKIAEEAAIYLAGGNSVDVGNIRDNVEEALKNIADRQFPEFKSKADALRWGQALTKAMAGNPDALNEINFKGEVQTHPIASEILRFIGNATKTGKDIRGLFMKSPYGWSQDAIDTIIILLKNAQQISTTETNLNAAKINGATFKKEVHIIGASDKIKIKSLFLAAGINCPPNQEIFPYSNEFLAKLKALANAISGDAPRQEPINTNFIKDIENKEGNERLLDILEQKDDLEAKFKDWTSKAAIVREREPLWTLLLDLISQAPDDAEMEEIKKEVDAIHENRLLLQEPDAIQPMVTKLTEKLNLELNKLKLEYNTLYDREMISLQANEYFSKITPDEKRAILINHQILAKPEIKVLSTEAILNQLQKLSFVNWKTKIAALSGQFQSALEEAILLSAPQAVSFSLPRGTISNQTDIDTYVAKVKKELETLLQQSSSIILK